jgi:hypothetical protein
LMNGTEKVVYPDGMHETESVNDDHCHSGSPKV